MSSNNINKLALELRKFEKEYRNINNNLNKEKDPKKRNKLFEKGKKIREKYLTMYAKIKELTAFNTPASTPVKSKKNNGNNNVQPIKKKSRKK